MDSAGTPPQDLTTPVHDPTEEIIGLRATITRQEQIIAALVDAAERHGDSLTQLGTQHLIERRTAEAYQNERMLRSVIEALDGALCIVGADGTILDANMAWLRQFSRFAPASHSAPASHVAPGTGKEIHDHDGDRSGDDDHPGALGTNFFTWCRAGAGIGDLATRVAHLAREALGDEGAPDQDENQPTRPRRERSVKGEVTIDDHPRWVVVRIHAIRGYAAARAVVSIIDITDGMRTQERLHAAITQAEILTAALSQEKTLLTGVISAVPQLVYWKDFEGRYVGCNAAYLAFRGLDEQRLLGRTEAQLATRDAFTTALESLEPEVIRSGTAVIDRKMELADSRGQVRSLLLSVLPLDDPPAGGRGVIGVGADITRARELEQQLAQANRLESIGQLAAGIAHELNTPVQYVADNVAFLTEATGNLLEASQRIATLTDGTDDHLPKPSAKGLVDEVRRILEPLELDFLHTEIPGALTESREGLSRVTEIVRAMKEYAHPGTSRREIDVNRAVRSTVQVCRNEWKYVAQVTLELDPDVGLTPCYEGDLKQVILNMIVNAAQAIGEDTRRRHDDRLGTITISTRRATEEILIVIKDDGPGMNESVRQRVFDPFFTTKEVGRGSGQGLSLAHAVIVTKHHGQIDLETAPGQGACFTLHLPLSPPSEAENDR